jgi:hypothetical protein
MCGIYMHNLFVYLHDCTYGLSWETSRCLHIHWDKKIQATVNFFLSMNPGTWPIEVHYHDIQRTSVIVAEFIRCRTWKRPNSHLIIFNPVSCVCRRRACSALSKFLIDEDCIFYNWDHKVWKQCLEQSRYSINIHLIKSSHVFGRWLVYNWLSSTSMKLRYCWAYINKVKISSFPPPSLKVCIIFRDKETTCKRGQRRGVSEGEMRENKGCLG